MRFADMYLSTNKEICDGAMEPETAPDRLEHCLDAVLNGRGLNVWS